MYPPIQVVFLVLSLVSIHPVVSLKWYNITAPYHRGALCNDFTPAGYFFEPSSNTSKWVVFLEGGGGCTSIKQCNERFIDQRIRRLFVNDNDEVDTSAAWDSFENEQLTATSKLMTSLWRYSARGDNDWEIDGTDMLASNPADNPAFFDYNKVLIPYCSSDLWLGFSNNYRKAMTNKSFQFVYDPTSKDNQFTFRGAAIFRSTIEDLFNYHDLGSATEVILAGSSAGGLGALNHAGWLKKIVKKEVKLSVLADSAWFIDFNGTLNFTKQRNELLIEDNEVICSSKTNDLSDCVIAGSILSQTDFPSDVPVLVIFSSYDLYLLSTRLIGLDDNTAVIGIMREVSEYSGSMINSLYNAVKQHSLLSYYVPSCFQHVYFANSELWGPDSLLGQEAIDATVSNNHFKHKVTQNVWNNFSLTCEGGLDPCLFTMSDAVYEWLSLIESNGTIRYLDRCEGPHCNQNCPEAVVLGELTPYWTAHSQYLIVFLILLLVTSSIVMKIILDFNFAKLKKLQKSVIEDFAVNPYKGLDSETAGLPFCDEKEAVSIACLNLRYSVSLSKSALKKAAKDFDGGHRYKRLLSISAAAVSDSNTKNLIAQRRATGWTVNRNNFDVERNQSDTQSNNSTSDNSDDMKSISQQLREFNRQFEQQNNHDEIEHDDVKSAQSEDENMSKDNGSINDLTSTIQQFQKQLAISNNQKHNYENDSQSDRSISLDNNAEDMVDALPKQVWQNKTSQRKPHVRIIKRIARKEKINKKKEIISGISAYCNPGELVAVMGPSGCGKTTFTDLLTGRKNIKAEEGSVYVNGMPFNKLYNWYIARTGYVLQLATPYYHTLTVRANLTLAAQMRLPKTLSLRKKLERVEQILEETGLISLANTKVGTDIGPGLSGGQKKRLCVALQLISLPSLLFLDEPTSGLDSSSSLELLTYLNKLASSNRTVILTIHQPRLEIFHMFTKIILLCRGKVAYHGVPEKVYQFFVDAHTKASLNVNKSIKNESNNPADIIIDMLGSEESSLAILKHYHNTNEEEMIVKAVKNAISDHSTHSIEARSSNMVGARFFDRVSALEARAKTRFKRSQALYLPFIFSLYGLLLGSVYFQSHNSTFILSAFGVFSCASGLFLFPIMHHYLYSALQIFYLEYSDGVGRPLDLVFQTFLRFSSLSALPVLIGVVSLYLLVIPYTEYNFQVFGFMFIANLALNQTWISIVILLITSFPNLSHRISPVLSAIAGFASGFFIPPGLMPKWYTWLFYINPNYYGFSAIARLILEDINLECDYHSPIECYPTTGKYLLTYFDLHTVNPFLHILVLLVMTLIIIVMSWLLLFVRLNYSTPKMVEYLKSRNPLRSKTVDPIIEPKNDLITTAQRNSTISVEEDTEVVGIVHNQDTKELQRRSSIMLNNGDHHEIWKPGHKLSRRFGSSESIAVRKLNLFNSIRGYQIPDNRDNDNMDSSEMKSNKKHIYGKPNKELLEKRRKQWEQIEIEALSCSSATRKKISDASITSKCPSMSPIREEENDNWDYSGLESVEVIDGGDMVEECTSKEVESSHYFYADSPETEV